MKLFEGVGYTYCPRFTSHSFSSQPQVFGDISHYQNSSSWGNPWLLQCLTQQILNNPSPKTPLPWFLCHSSSLPSSPTSTFLSSVSQLSLAAHPTLLFKSTLKDMLVDFRERDSGWEEREKQMPPAWAPTRDWICNLCMCPDGGSNL